jgi:hypothetical protein
MKYQVYEVTDRAHNQGICLAADYSQLCEYFDKGEGFNPNSSPNLITILGEIDLDERTLEAIIANSSNGTTMLRFFDPIEPSESDD